ncbi:MAG: tRNA (adenosine(37)-N6)-dimethylallyltransferase MiaA [Actinomycetota bacterium]|nr:tRNA (adenosine(37)-N6)-dimethylallyltransferase MiaA [Actinomycetota bacterium]
MKDNTNFDNFKIKRHSIVKLKNYLLENKLDLENLKNKLIKSKKLVVICGPTCAGKSKIGIILSKLLDTDIISIDSIQVYREMDIGTDKFDADKYGKKQYMVDMFDPDHDLSVVEFRKICDEIIKKKFISLNKIPLLAGGSGLYIKSVISGIDNVPDRDNELRKKIIDGIKKEGIKRYYLKLKKVDREYAEKISENDMRRIVRALEVYELTGKRFSRMHKKWKNKNNHYYSILIGLEMKRDILYGRIEKRVDKMFDIGLVREVKKLVGRGYGNCRSITKAVGYKEVLEYLNGNSTIEECKDKVKRNTRRLAKKQITWFGSMPEINWIRLDNYDNIFNLIRDILLKIGSN